MAHTYMAPRNRRAVDGHSAQEIPDTGATGAPGAIPHGQGTLLHKETERDHPQGRKGESLRPAALRSHATESLNEHIPPLVFRGKNGKPWHPWHGFTRRALEHAREYARTDPQALLTARIDTFLYSAITGRIPAGEVKHLDRAWYRIREAKLQAGEWIELKPYIRFRKGGKPNGEAAVYMLSPVYRREIMESGQQYGHFAGYGRLTARRRLAPEGKADVFGPVPAKLKAALRNGTGLKARPEVIHAMIENPAAFLDLVDTPGTALELLMDAVKVWRLFSPQLPGEELVPTWELHDCLWLYSSKPCIQQLPAFIRLNALEGVNGEPVTEWDYSGCQLNISQYEGGESMYDDPYTVPLKYLRQYDNYGDIDRETVKALTIAILHGRTHTHYQWLYWHDQVKYPVQVHDLLSEIIPQFRGHPLMQRQGRVMLYALEILTADGSPPGLPVFDSIVHTDADRVKWSMEEAARKVIGEPVPMKQEHPGQLSFRFA